MERNPELEQSMEQHGYYLDTIDSYDGWLVFNYEGGRIAFTDWWEVAEFVDNVMWEDLWVSWHAK